MSQIDTEFISLDVQDLACQWSSAAVAQLA